MPTITGAHHAAFTVTDADRSAAWYADLLGLMTVLSGDDDDVSFRVLAHPDCGWVLSCGVRGTFWDRHRSRIRSRRK
jgi:catechol 2,3-dioxygenase-like lactoylglutathione lyase family enzyme